MKSIAQNIRSIDEIIIQTIPKRVLNIKNKPLANRIRILNILCISCRFNDYLHIRKIQ
jgi:hypothetical protein